MSSQGGSTSGQPQTFRRASGDGRLQLATPQGDLLPCRAAEEGLRRASWPTDAHVIHRTPEAVSSLAPLPSRSMPPLPTAIPATELTPASAQSEAMIIMRRWKPEQAADFVLLCCASLAAGMRGKGTITTEVLIFLLLSRHQLCLIWACGSTQDAPAFHTELHRLEVLAEARPHDAWPISNHPAVDRVLLGISALVSRLLFICSVILNLNGVF